MKAEITVNKFSKYPIVLSGYGDEILLTRDEAIQMMDRLEKAVHECQE